GGKRVGQLVDEHGGKEKERGDDGHRPVKGRAPVGQSCREQTDSQRKADEEKRDDPAGMNFNGDVSNRSDTPRGRHATPPFPDGSWTGRRPVTLLRRIPARSCSWAPPL